MWTHYDALAARILVLLEGSKVMIPPSFDDLDRREQQIVLAVCAATKMTPEQWNELEKPSREPWMKETIKTLMEAVKVTTDPEGENDKQPDDTPKTLLNGWHDITAALDMKYSQRSEIKRLNERFSGPIHSSGAGTKPIVYRENLFAWWNKLAVEQQELANRRKGAILSAGAQHNYGREGTVAPELGGSVKKRRRPKQT